MSEQPSVVLVEDHIALRKGLELLLRDRGFHVTGVTDSAQEGYELFGKRRPDVAVIDIGLADGSGLELAQRILDEDPEAGVLVYTGLSDPAAIEAAARSGTRGFALKAGGPDELVTAIEAVARGGVYLDPTVAALLGPGRSRASVLSGREREILDLLASGMTGEQAASQLFLSPETVRTHIRNAMRKLNARTRVHAIALAVQMREIEL
jgi:DNA-binding NarL/FixJ family response regulator